MRKLALSGIMAGIAVIGAMAGVALESWRADHALTVHPCAVRVWQPSVGYVDQSQSVRDCLSLGAPKLLTGDWADYGSGEGFRLSDGAVSTSYDIDADELTRARLHWLGGERGFPQQYTGRTYHVRLVGRVGHRNYPILDGNPDVIVVDRLLSVRAEPSPRQRS